MSFERRNAYLDAGFSDESDQDAGYDSEAAEVSKTGRASKRRKTEHESSDDEEFFTPYLNRRRAPEASSTPAAARQPESEDEENDNDNDKDDEKEKHLQDEGRRAEGDVATRVTEEQSPSIAGEPAHQKKPKKSTSKSKETTPGVVYLSSLPPYLKPSALRNLLEQRGFSPISRLFLSPASRHAHNSKKNSRQLYTEGWIEFSSKKVARRCAEALNATTVGGKKGGWYRDDVWNMKYLKGMRWEELMAGVREEKREEEGRRDEERRIIARETKRFIEGVEEGRRVEGMKRKKAIRRGDDEEAPSRAGAEAAVADVRRTWRQTEVKGKKKGHDTAGPEKISDDVKQVLNRIF